jgi:hypothetical protein
MSLKMPRKKEKAISEDAFLALLFPRYRLALSRSGYARVPGVGNVFKKLHMVMYRYTAPLKYAPKRPLMKQHEHKCPSCKLAFNCRGRACEGAGPDPLEVEGDVYCKHCWSAFSD